MRWLFFLFDCSHCSIVMKIDMQTNKAATNIFGLHNQPRKITRYTKKIEARVVRWGGGGGFKRANAI